jgi:hypothetical protein
MLTFCLQKTTYRMKLTDALTVDLIGKAPCWFHRFMMRLVFGFKFEIVGDHAETELV